MKRLFATTLLVASLTAPLISVADDWPQYRGPLGDGVSQESIPAINWAAKPPKTLWKSPTPLGFSSLSIADGRVFTLVARDTGGEAKAEVCLALDAKTGKELWSVPLGNSDYGNGGGNAGAPDNRGGDGPRSTPTTDGKHVFVFDAHLTLACLDATNGETVWKHQLAEEFDGRNIKWLNATSPLMIGDTLYVAGGGAGQSFLAFNKNTGELRWKSGDATLTHATPRYATIGGTNQVIFLAKAGLAALDVANGKQLWGATFPFSVSTAASPIVSGDLVYCSAGYGVGAELFRVTGKPEAESVWSKPNKLMNHWSTPVLRDGHLYGIYEFKKYGRAPLQCVELATGEIKWTQRGFGPGNCILVGDKLVVLSDAGEVAVVAAKPDSYQEFGRVQAVTGKCWSTPAYSNGQIFVRSTEEAACLLVK